jgi:hypothetical protein
MVLDIPGHDTANTSACSNPKPESMGETVFDSGLIRYAFLRAANPSPHTAILHYLECYP